LEVAKHAMAKHRGSERTNVIVPYVCTPVKERASLATKHEILRGAHACAIGHIPADKLRASGRSGTCAPHELNGEFHNLVRHRDAPHEPLVLDQVVALEYPSQFGLAATGGTANDRYFVCRRQIVHYHLKHESIQLSLRQRVRAFQFDRVLCGEHEERLLQFVRASLHGYVPLLHGLQQSGLSFRRRAIDLVCKHNVREQRTRNERQVSPAFLILLDYVGSSDVRRHEVRRKLDTVEFQVQDSRDRAYQERLGQSRNTDNQAVPTAEQCDEGLLHNVVLPHDNLAQLAN